MAKIPKEALPLRYGRIAGKFWLSALKHGWDDATTCLAAYLLTCDHHPIEGVFRLPLNYIMADRGWPREKVITGLTRLWEDRFCFYHGETEIIFLPKALKYQVPKGDKQIHGCLRRLAAFEEHPLFPYFLRAAHLYTQDKAPEFHEELTSWFDPDLFGSYDTNETHDLDLYLVDQPHGRLSGDQRATNERRSPNLKLNLNLKRKRNTETESVSAAEQSCGPPSSLPGSEEDGL